MPDFGPGSMGYNNPLNLGGHLFIGASDSFFYVRDAAEYQNSYINVLRVKAKNIDLTKYNLKDTIQGYIIGYQQRNSDVNTRIIDYGFIRPYFQYERAGASQSPKYRNAFYNGSGRYVTEDKGWSSQEAIGSNSPYYMYHSVDTTFLGKEIKSSYKLEQIGIALNGVPNFNVSKTYLSYLPLLVYKTVTEAARAEAWFFFEEQLSVYNSPISTGINNAQLVPNIYEANGVGQIGTNIKLNGCNSYWHIETTTGFPTFNNISQIRDNQIFYRQKAGVGLNETNGDTFQMLKNHITLTIARITNPIDFQYGPLSSAEYAPLLTRFDDENLDILNADSLILEGDTYVCKTFMRRYDNFNSHGEDVKTGGGEGLVAQMLIGFYCESRNNLALRYKEVDGAEYYPKNRIIASQDPNSQGIMNRGIDTITFPYNKQYSAVNNVKVNVTIPDFFKEVTKFPNRSIYSYTAFESDIVDRYRIFPSNQFHDIPKDRGVITDTFVFNNTFFHHTEYGLWQSFFNPNTTQATSQGEITLGNGGIFKLPSKLVLDIKGGYMGTMDKSGTNTPFGRVFLDHHQGKIFLFSGEAPVEISDLGLFFFFREFVNTKSKYAMGYDWANKRLLITNYGSKKELIDFNSNNSVNNPIYIRVLNTNRHFSSYNAGTSTQVQNVYEFKFEKTTQIQFSLKSQNNNSTTPSDYNIQILDRTYNILFTSASSGNEELKITLDQGLYYIKVYKVSGLNDYDLYIYLDTGNTISFYPKTQTWTSLHDFVPTAYLTLNGSSHAWQDSSTSFWNLSNLGKFRKQAHITLVENTQPDAFKRFDRIEMNTMSGSRSGLSNQNIPEPGSIINSDNYVFINKSFTSIHCWTDRQNTTELLFANETDYNYDTNFLNSYDSSKVPLKYYKGSFHAELPLDAVVDPNKNIFDNISSFTPNLDINAEFRSHMKGKFLYIKLSYNDIYSNPLVLNYVKTFFKPTVA